jgi:hypothetical protein
MNIKLKPIIAVSVIMIIAIGTRSQSFVKKKTDRTPSEIQLRFVVNEFPESVTESIAVRLRLKKNEDNRIVMDSVIRLRKDEQRLVSDEMVFEKGTYKIEELTLLTDTHRKNISFNSQLSSFSL